MTTLILVQKDNGFLEDTNKKTAVKSRFKQ